jgi:hypothetical protein
MSLRELYKQYAPAIAYIAVCDKKGDQSIGSAFHVGEGVFVTARHVVENREILEVATTARAQLIAKAEANDEPKPLHEENPLVGFDFVEPSVVQVAEGPFYHADKSVDVAVFRVHGLDPRTPHVPLGTALEIDLEDDSFVLTEAVVLGYPPIPNTNIPRLVAVRAEVNAVVDTRHTSHTHFVVSGMARGGFSGIWLRSWPGN